MDVCIVGGCGHVGLPLAITLADSGLRVCIHDVNDISVAKVNDGIMPFLEEGAEPILKRVIGKTLTAANDPNQIGQSRFVIVVIGTPVDEHLNPTFHAISRFFKWLTPQLNDGQCVILRSTVYPGTTQKVSDLVRESGKNIAVAFCPERVAEGYAMRELRVLPQIVSGTTPNAVAMASELFGRICTQLIELDPLEAELTKIFANVWRYIQFAAANQLFMIASDLGLDFSRIHKALIHDYPRLKNMPFSGFAAGPCLLKDTMQLASLCNNSLGLGHAAMLINEGLPNFIIKHIKTRHPLNQMKVGVLGMAFKGGSDDPRESLSYKLRKILEYEARQVICTDVHIQDPHFLPAETVVAQANLLILATPHPEYRQLIIPETLPLVDVWNFFGKGTTLS